MSAMSAFPDFPMGWLNLVGTITVESMFLTSKYRAKPYKFVLPILGYLWIFGLMLQAYLIPLVRINHCYIPSPIFFFGASCQARTIPWGIGRSCRVIASEWCGDLRKRPWGNGKKPVVVLPDVNVGVENFQFLV